MRNESQKTLIAVVREHVAAWRKGEGWSRESVVDIIVKAHQDSGADTATGIRFEPSTRDVFERMKVNADRIFRWLDDETKDNNLLPVNFLPSILRAMPDDVCRQCLDDILRPLGATVRQLVTGGGETIGIGLVSQMLREQTEAIVATTELLTGEVTKAELVNAHREVAEAIAAGQRVLQAIEAQLPADAPAPGEIRMLSPGDRWQ